MINGTDAQLLWQGTTGRERGCKKAENTRQFVLSGHIGTVCQPSAFPRKTPNISYVPRGNPPLQQTCMMVTDGWDPTYSDHLLWEAFFDAPVWGRWPPLCSPQALVPSTVKQGCQQDFPQRLLLSGLKGTEHLTQ